MNVALRMKRALGGSNAGGAKSANNNNSSNNGNGDNDNDEYAGTILGLESSSTTPSGSGSADPLPPSPKRKRRRATRSLTTPASASSIPLVLRQLDFYVKIIPNEETCNKFLRTKELLPQDESGYCNREKNGVLCNGILKDFMKKNRNGTYSKTLRCTKRGCQEFVSIRKSNRFFSLTDETGRIPGGLTICQIMELVWLWSHLQSEKLVEKLTGRDRQIIHTWYTHCRQVCDMMFQLRTPMGGPGEIIHVDEYLFPGLDLQQTCNSDESFRNSTGLPDDLNEKKNYGNRVHGPWAFVLYWRRPDKIFETRFFIVDKREAESLIPIIQTEVVPGTTIHSDKWSAYSCLPNFGYPHETLRTSKVYFDPVTGKRTKIIDKLWGMITEKYDFNSCSSDDIELILREEWWRSCNPSDVFNCFLRDLKIVHCNDEYDESVSTLMEMEGQSEGHHGDLSQS